MASPDYLSGLLKWVKRPEWASGFQAVLQDHIGARFIELNGKRIMSGGALLLDPAVSEQLLEKIHTANDQLRDMLRQESPELDQEPERLNGISTLHPGPDNNQLTHLETAGATLKSDGDPLGTYDLGWMWKELGIENPRK